MPPAASEAPDLPAPASCYESPGCEVRTDEHSERYRTVQPGHRLAVRDRTVHVRKASDPDAIEGVSCVVEHESGAFFHGGDSPAWETFHEVGDVFDIDAGVLAFADAGATVVNASVEESPKRENAETPTHDLIRERGGTAGYVEADVSTRRRGGGGRGRLRARGVDATANNAGVHVAAYESTKAAVWIQIRSAAVDLADEGIRVTAVAPGRTVTEFRGNAAEEKARSA